jgi:hypothetical protein
MQTTHPTSACQANCQTLAERAPRPSRGASKRWLVVSGPRGHAVEHSTTLPSWLHRSASGTVAALLAGPLLMASPAPAALAEANNPPKTSSSSSISISFASKEVKEKLKQRDVNMAWKCTGVSGYASRVRGEKPWMVSGTIHAFCQIY